jgi:hypothetical protein
VKVCIVTSVPAAVEPRGPRHAVAFKELFPEAEVLFVDMAPQGLDVVEPPVLRAARGVRRETIRYPSRNIGMAALALRKAQVAIARGIFDLTGHVVEALFGDRVVTLTRYLKQTQADIYFAHNIETLLPAARAAESLGGLLMFDCMEYYSSMGDSQSSSQAAGAKKLEARWLPRCSLVTASGELLAERLSEEYKIPRPITLYNTPAPVDHIANDKVGGFSLYWRNSVIGFGQRGLDDMLVALTELPTDISLSVQGRLPMDGGAGLRERIAALGLEGRVTLLPPYDPGEVIAQAARHSVGLCLERRGPLNHELTVSNKLFDYMMAGLPVVVADLPSLRLIVERSGGGLLFEPGSPSELAAQIRRLYESPDLVRDLAGHSRSYALSEGNAEVEMARLRSALKGAVDANASALSKRAGRGIGAPRPLA